MHVAYIGLELDFSYLRYTWEHGRGYNSQSLKNQYKLLRFFHYQKRYYRFYNQDLAHQHIDAVRILLQVILYPTERFP